MRLTLTAADGTLDRAIKDGKIGCLTCGKSFVRGRRSQRFCSRQCRRYGPSVDRAGKRYGRLLVESVDPGRHDKHHRIKWLCLCDCGKRVLVASSSLEHGITRSCGCWKNDLMAAMSSTHGRSKTVLYRTWCNMKARCYNHNSTRFYGWGGRGIGVCDRWRDSFENFAADMGEPPTSKHTIERRNNDAGYSPENCCWATRREQGRNKSSNRLFAYNGQTMTLTEWAESRGFRRGTLWHRLKKGWAFADAINTPLLGKAKL